MLNEIDKMLARFGAMIVAYDANVNLLAEANQKLTKTNEELTEKLALTQEQLMNADSKCAELEKQLESNKFPVPMQIREML